ncbi:unnamed protein product, partial [Mesorhabditis belari]|uniref:SAP30-binding protein n=1 Tax=Mesorhabditis belari TaxID=2138241 RepID=A0AAF3FD47_9BILA
MSLPSLVAYGGDDSDSNEEMDTGDQRTQSNVDESPMDVSKNVRKESELWDDGTFDNADDSDEERRSSNKSASPLEPPPPPGHNNRRNTPPSVFATNFHKVESVVSLVGYSGEEDTFTKYDNEHREDSRMKPRDDPESSGSSSRSGMEMRQSSPKVESHERENKEPRPPARLSYDDEETIDQIIREGQEAINEGHMFADDRSPGSPSPMPGQIDDKEYVEGPEKEDGPCELPSDAEDDPDPKVMEKFARCFEQKANGFDFNGLLQSDRKFTNPSGYVNIKKRFNIDETGTNFSKSLFDPNMFPEDCFYDKLGDVQAKMMEAWQKRPK